MATTAPVLRHRVPRWQKLLIAASVVVGLGCIAALSSVLLQFRGANRVFDGFTDALISKNYTAAYQFTAPEFRAAANYDDFVKVNRDLTDRMGELKKVETNQSDVNEHHDGWVGVIDAELTFAKGDLEFKFKLKKENGVWKIFGY